MVYHQSIKIIKGSEHVNYSLIHCIDMMNLYNDFITNQDSDIYKELKNINKTICSFIKHMHNCKHVVEELQLKNICPKQLNERLIEFTTQ